MSLSESSHSGRRRKSVENGTVRNGRVIGALAQSSLPEGKAHSCCSVGWSGYLEHGYLLVS